MSLVSEQDIKSAYRGEKTAANYVKERFVAELYRLLHERQVETVNSALAANRCQRVLEVAPGPGRLTRDIRPSGELVCLEYNEGMIAEGKASCPPAVRWVQGDGFALPFEEEFDCLYTFRFVRHFHREDRDRLYGQFRKVLKPGGVFIMDAVNAVVSAPLRAREPEAYPIYDKLYQHPNELRAELRESGFEVLTILPVQRWHSLQSKAQVLLGPRSRLLCRLAIRTLEKLRSGPSLEWIVTCRRA